MHRGKNESGRGGGKCVRLFAFGKLRVLLLGGTGDNGRVWREKRWVINGASVCLCMCVES